MHHNDEIAALQDQLTGALVGLARAAAGNEELITRSTGALVREALQATRPQAAILPATLDRLRTQVAAEKAHLAPNCANCDHPCGRNEDYDLACLRTAPEDTRRLKLHILSNLRDIAAAATDNADDAFLLRTLEMLGNEWDAEDLQRIACKTEMHLLRQKASSQA